MYTFRPAITRSTMKIKVGGIKTNNRYILVQTHLLSVWNKG